MGYLTPVPYRQETLGKLSDLLLTILI
ncbi:hypothetical protein [Paenibacillus sp. SYP-B4298]